MFKSHARALPPVTIAIFIVALASRGTCIPAAHAAPQDPPAGAERTSLQLDIVVTQSHQSPTEPGSSEPLEGRTWRFAALTTSSRTLRMQNADADLQATLHRLEDSRVAVAFDLTVYTQNEPVEAPRRPGPPNTLVIEARVDEVVLEDAAPTVVAALTDETGHTVEVTFTATVVTNAR